MIASFWYRVHARPVQTRTGSCLVPTVAEVLLLRITWYNTPEYKGNRRCMHAHASGNMLDLVSVLVAVWIPPLMSAPIYADCAPRELMLGAVSLVITFLSFTFLLFSINCILLCRSTATR